MIAAATGTRAPASKVLQDLSTSIAAEEYSADSKDDISNNDNTNTGSN